MYDKGLNHETFRKLKKCQNIVASLRFVHKKKANLRNTTAKGSNDQIICQILMVLCK